MPASLADIIEWTDSGMDYDPCLDDHSCVVSSLSAYAVEFHPRPSDRGASFGAELVPHSNGPHVSALCFHELIRAQNDTISSLRNCLELLEANYASIDSKLAVAQCSALEKKMRKDVQGLAASMRSEVDASVQKKVANCAWLARLRHE